MVKKQVIAAILLATAFGIAFAEDVHEGLNTSDGNYRTYFLHTPPGYDGQTPLPLVISLHFLGGTGEGMAYVTGMSYKADEENFIVAYPDALGGVWRGYDTLFMFELLDTLCVRYAVDTLRVYMTGYSDGALMTHWMACKMSSRLGAAAPVAGTMLTYDWLGCWPERTISIVSLNARNDPVMPYEGDGQYLTGVEEAMSNWAERLGCDQGPDSFYRDEATLRQTWSRSDGACDVVLWTTEDGGHGWPTDSSPHKLSANDVMWDFFVAHPLPGSGDIVELTPDAFTLDAPAIFTKSATILFSLAQSEPVTLTLFDVLGRKLTTLVDERLEAGEHQVVLDAAELSTGVYFYRLVTPTLTQTRSITVIK
jgi:polyhydroxybutyrate depolymerase